MSHSIVVFVSFCPFRFAPSDSLSLRNPVDLAVLFYRFVGRRALLILQQGLKKSLLGSYRHGPRFYIKEGRLLSFAAWEARSCVTGPIIPESAAQSV